MPSFTYNPGPGDPEVIRTLGRTFIAGEPVDIEDENDPVARKLAGHPHFQRDGQDRPSTEPDENTVRAEADLEQKIDGRTKAAREAKQRALEAHAEAEAAQLDADNLARARVGRTAAEQRALDREASLRSAQNDPDRDNPNPNGGAASDPQFAAEDATAV